MRTRNSLLNLITAFGGQMLSIIVGFIARLVFVRCLSQEYLGLSGVFTNVLSMLSLVELGVGPAMTFALYQPLAQNNIKKIKGLMQLYRKAYIAIGGIMFTAGLLFMPLYPFFITTQVEIPHLNAIYLLYVCNTAISYFYSYKRSILEADQKKYQYNILHYLIYTAVNIAQIIGLLVTKNYMVFMIIQIVFTWLENIIISKLADKQYPYLKDKKIEKLPREIKDPIWRNVKAMVFHKIGNIVVTSTDNLLLSKFIGLAAAGIYANYYMITSALNKVIMQIFHSVLASVGNLNVSSGLEKKRQVYQRLLFLNFWVYSWTTVGLLCLLQPLVQMMFGAEYLFDDFTVCAICASYFTMGMRKAILTYKDASGLYYRDWFKPLLEAGVNLAVSLFLLQYFGAAGIFLGTIISTLGVSAWIEAYIVYKDVLCYPFFRYFLDYFKYAMVALAICGISYAVCALLPAGMTSFVLKIIVVALLPNLLIGIIFYKTDELRYFLNLTKKLRKK